MAAIVISLACAASLVLTAPVAGATSSPIPLFGWYIATRTDYFTTTDPGWAGSPGAWRGGYEFQRVEGLAFPPDQPQPPDTVPLYTWWDPGRLDNFTTSDPAWAGSPGAVKGSYYFVRKEGYVYANAVAGTWKLTNTWNGTAGTLDNRLSSDPRPQPAGYWVSRVEGFALPTAEPPVNPMAYGWRRDRLTGTRPVLTLLVQTTATPTGTSTFPASRSRAHFQSLFFEPTKVNLASFFSDNSQGAFTVSNAGVLGPFTVTGFAAFQSAVPSAITQAGQAGFDFSRFDNNPEDGLVQPHELAIIYINDSATWWGQTSSTIAVTCPPPAPTSTHRVCLAPTVSGMWMHTDLMHAAHELFHQVAPAEHDLYGDFVTQCQSVNQTLMSCTGGSPTATTEQLRTAFHLDPWHKMIHGWLQPRVVATGNGSGCATLHAPNRGISWGDAPLLITRAGTPDRYYFAEFRNSGIGSAGTPVGSLTGTDRDHPGRGMVLWYVELDAALNPRVVPDGMMRPGPDGVIDSIIPTGADDFYTSPTGAPPWTGIGPGPNRAPDTTPVDDDSLGIIETVWTVGSPANGAPGARGGISTWGPADGDAELRFSRVGVSPTGSFHLRVGRYAETSSAVAVEWFDESIAPFRPRVDTVAPAAATPGMLLTFDGVFGVDQTGRRAVLEGAAGMFPLTINSWSCTRVTAGVPSSVPPGFYRLVVYGDAGVAAASNAQIVRIA